MDPYYDIDLHVEFLPNCYLLVNRHPMGTHGKQVKITYNAVVRFNLDPEWKAKMGKALDICLDESKILLQVCNLSGKGLGWLKVPKRWVNLEEYPPLW